MTFAVAGEIRFKMALQHRLMLPKRGEVRGSLAFS
jgi:hypothetical protein